MEHEHDRKKKDICRQIVKRLGLGLGTWDLGLGTWDLGPGTWDMGIESTPVPGDDSKMPGATHHPTFNHLGAV